MSKSALLLIHVAVAMFIGAVAGGCRDVSFRLANRTVNQAGGGATGGPGGEGDTSLGGRGGGGGGAGGETVPTGGQSGGGAGGATVTEAGGATQPACADPLAFADPDVEAQVRQAIGVPTGPIHPADVAGLTDLLLIPPNIPPIGSSGPLGCADASRAAYYDVSPPSAEGLITSLQGVECLPSVQRIWLDPICVDLGPLARLPNLTSLWFGPTEETNIPRLPSVTTLGYVVATSNTAALLRSLPSLTTIGGGIHGLIDIAGFDRGYLDFSTADERAALADLPNLTRLELTNQTDISFVAGLTQLTTLAVGWNVQDISALSGLVGLVHLVLDDNPISDLAPLVANPGLGTGDDVSILNANLNCAQQQKNIAALRSRGVTLKTDCP